MDRTAGFYPADVGSIPTGSTRGGKRGCSCLLQFVHADERYNPSLEADVERLLAAKDYRTAVARSFLVLNKMVAELAVPGNTIYSPDAYTHKLYSADIRSVRVTVDYPFNDVSRLPYSQKMLSHRARVGGFRENTLDAFVEVLRTKVRHIEIDVRFSKDGVAYVHHDAFFRDDETSFRFSEKVWEEIEAYRYKQLRISRLEDVVKHFRDYRGTEQVLALDLKDFGHEQDIYELCERYGVLEATSIFTWAPQTIFAFDEIFKEAGKSIPLFFSYVRSDSIFSLFLIPRLLSGKRFFPSFRDFVLVGDHNYREALGEYAKGYRHVPYFTRLPGDLVEVLRQYGGGVCVTKKMHRWGDWYLRALKRAGLKVVVFGAFFGTRRIDTKEEFLFEAEKEYVDLVFVDDLEQML